MPLNGELKNFGTAFSRATQTALSYGLYALAGTKPPKPGLVRSSGNDCSMTDVEVWHLTPAAFGRFVAAIPAPLGIGAIELADGTTAKGFLVEPVARLPARKTSPPMAGGGRICGAWRRSSCVVAVRAV